MAPTNVAIRPAGLDDLDVLLRYRRGMLFDMGYTDPAVLDRMRANAEPFLRDAIAKGEWRAWLAEQGDPVGCGAVQIVRWIPGASEPTPRRAWLHNVYVEPEFRRLGIARMLVETIVDWCRAEGFPAVYLHASTMGRSLYEQLGFRATNEMRLEL